MSSSEMTHICLIQLRRRERETRKREEGEKLIGIKSLHILHHIWLDTIFLNISKTICGHCVISFRFSIDKRPQPMAKEFVRNNIKADFQIGRKK